MPTINPGLMSSVRPDWPTPKPILDLIRQFSQIILDPCSNPESIVNAKINLSLENGDDGLTADWFKLAGNNQTWTQHQTPPNQAALIYVNSPYGRAIKVWTQKIVVEAQKGAEIIALVPSRTDTSWFSRDIFNEAQSICFWRGRITFLGADGPAPFPSALVYYGKRADQFETVFNQKGRCVRCK